MFSDCVHMKHWAKIGRFFTFLVTYKYASYGMLIVNKQKRWFTFFIMNFDEITVTEIFLQFENNFHGYKTVCLFQSNSTKFNGTKAENLGLSQYFSI